MGGLFGVISNQNCFDDLWYGTDYNSHLGADSAGLAILGRELFETVSHDIKGSQFKTAFNGDRARLRELKGFAGIGVISDIKNDKQPIRIASKMSNFSVATTGLVKNAEDLFYELEGEGVNLKEWFNQTEIVGRIIAKENSIEDGVREVYKKIEGGVSILLLSEKDGKIYASGDIFPLAVGKNNKRGDFAVTTDTTAFLNQGYEIVDSLNYREIVTLTPNGIENRVKTTEKNIMCPFLDIYFTFPAYEMFGINSEVVRQRCGGFLAAKDDVKADYVFGVESSGLPHGVGYAKKKLEMLKKNSMKLFESLEQGEVDIGKFKEIMKALQEQTPIFNRSVIKYIPGWARSYIPSEQEDRDMIADKKQVPNRQLIEGKALVVVDDSIRRGTQLERYKRNKIDPYNPKEVHGRIGSPIQMFPCFYDTKTKKEHLATFKAIYRLEGEYPEDASKYMDPTSLHYRAMVEQMTKTIGLDSLLFVTVDEMVEAIVGAPGNQGITRKNLCLYCWTGVDPTK